MEMGMWEGQDIQQAHLGPGGILPWCVKSARGVIGTDTVSRHISTPCREGHNPSLPVLGFVRARGFFPSPKYRVRAGEMLPRDISGSWKNNLLPPAFLLEQQQPSPQKSAGDISGVRRREQAMFPAVCGGQGGGRAPQIVINLASRLTR